MFVELVFGCRGKKNMKCIKYFLFYYYLMMMDMGKFVLIGCVEVIFGDMF